MASTRKASKAKNDNKEFFEALRLMEEERGIPKEFIAEKIAEIRADREIIPLPLDILQDKEVQVPLVVLRIRHRPADHPRSLGDKNGLLDLAVDALDGAFPALSLRRADRHGQQEEES